jgi:hypothetical protein
VQLKNVKILFNPVFNAFVWATKLPTVWYSLFKYAFVVQACLTALHEALNTVMINPKGSDC